jgi:CubicO group peptidase (beta-lactamase class C family)/uncharacterized membrane protein
MAIERRALFAISIAFTASIVGYPDLPPDIPPQAGRDGAFIGAPFVAFLLPVTALVIWWIVASLSKRSPTAAPHSHSAGAATALFLSAFHVTTLIAFIGGQLWLGRILGGMVGLFLIATGNEFPRLRPNLAWGIRTGQTLASDDLWRRVHRLSGYIRVVMGLVVCLAALSGMRGLTQVIVLAICVETVIGISAATFFSRRAAVLVGLLLFAFSDVASRAEAQGIPPKTIDSLPAFMDATVPKLMEQAHVMGSVVGVVYDGRIVLLRGYGQSRLDSDRRVDPLHTLFRIGSVSKFFTAVAALQMVDAGKLDLQRAIRDYVPDIPLRYGATTHQLLTHTAGLDERFAGAYTDAPDRLTSLSDHLRLDPPKQVIRPGSVYSYSNYHYALAGLVVERLSGLTYDTYMADRIFNPLRMTATTAHQPPEPNTANDLARGYRWADGHQEQLPYRFTYAGPSGGISTTAADMVRLMIALLGDGSVDGQRILSLQSVKMLVAAQYSPDPRIPATAYGLKHWLTHGHQLLFADGTLGDQIGVLVLDPADKLGIFLASNALPGIEPALDPVLTFLFGPTVSTSPPTPLPDALRRAPRFAGTYRDYHHTRADMSRLMALMPMVQSRVRVESDGAIRWQGRRWLEVEPLVFRNADSGDYIVFRENRRGDITELHAWGATYERIGWVEQTRFHMGVLVSCVIAFLAYPLSRGLRAIRGRRAPEEGRVARGCALFVAFANLAFVVGLAVFFRGLGASIPLPLPVILWLSLPLASVAVTALLPAFVARAWREAWWTRGERLAFSTLAALSVAFMTFLNYWKLLGIRY